MIFRRFLVIGAGPTGIGAAVRLAELGEDFLLVDEHRGPGGMAASVTDKRGFTWDMGGHVLHSHFDAFNDAIAASGAEMNSIRRNGWVWMHNDLIRTPIQRNLKRLPTDLRPDAECANLADYYRNNFGQELFDTFFEPYTRKMWATPLDRIDDSWVSLRSGSGERNVPALGLASTFEDSDDRFPYPVGGTGALWSGLCRAKLDPGRLRFRTRVIDVDVPRRVATLDDGEQVMFQFCVSTAPIRTATVWAGLESLGRPLRTSCVYAIGLGFDGHPPAALADKTWLYSPDDDVPWYRATMLSNYDRGNAGPGRWNVMCEVSTSADRPMRRADAVRGSIDAVVRLGADPDALVDVWQRTVPMGYPVPTLGRDDALREIDDALLAHGIHSRGRFGGWRYESCNQDYSYAQGRQAVDHALTGVPEDVFWHPERF